jgi:2,3-bisphosphoglycerate-independent phosphoglycerate mutase
MVKKRPVILTIMDGFGHSTVLEGNAVHHARKPNFERLMASFPNTLIEASGPWVGLPEGQMGNSEVGHLNIGAGRIIYMDVTRIDRMIASGELFQNEALLCAMERGRSRRLHLMGLLSDGGVHSHIGHLFALIEMAKKQGVNDVSVHCFLDGRDTPPESGLGFVGQLEAHMMKTGTGRIGSVIGRYYAMDRDRRWERVERAFKAMVTGEAASAVSAAEAVRRSYAAQVTDEFLEPVTIVDASGEPTGLIRDGDAAIFFNFRADRGRQLTMALTGALPLAAPRMNEPKNLHLVTMTEYDKTFQAPFVVASETPENTLGAVVSAAGLRNLRTAETEKYPHVTYFFNGGIEKPYEGEERQLVASPKVATYDLQPEMSAYEVCDVVTRAIAGGGFDVIVVNFANPDMVGHSGKFGAAVKAVETVDECLGRIWKALETCKDAAWLVTADHGNAETMIDPETGGPHTYHTTNPVPLIIAANEKAPLRAGGSLRDLAPTMLGLLGLPKPSEMTGEDLRMVGSQSR